MPANMSRKTAPLRALMARSPAGQKVATKGGGGGIRSAKLAKDVNVFPKITENKIRFSRHGFSDPILTFTKVNKSDLMSVMSEEQIEWHKRERRPSRLRVSYTLLG